MMIALAIFALAVTAVQDAMPIVSPAPPPPPILRSPGGPKGNPGLWFRAEDYPRGPKRAGAQGRVSMLLSVDRKGRVSKCTIVESSGFPDLDSATCAIAVSRAEFYPRLNAKGKSEPYTWPIRTRWVLS